MKEKMLYLLFTIAAVAVIGGFLYALRMINNAATPITVHEVEAGVKCATMVTSDGAAISCWKI